MTRLNKILIPLIALSTIPTISISCSNYKKDDDSTKINSKINKKDKIKKEIKIEDEEELLAGQLYKYKYQDNPLLYSKLRNKNNNTVINNPFRKLTFKTENKEQELINFIKENKVEGYFMLSINFELENNNIDSREEYEKEFKIWLSKAKEITFLYFPHAIRLVVPDQFNDINEYFTTPFKEHPEFKIPFSNAEIFIDNKVKFINPLYFDTWEPGESKYLLLRIQRKNKITYDANKTVDVVDMFKIWVNHYSEEAPLWVVLERFYPYIESKREQTYIEEYKIDVKKFTHKNEIFVLDY